MGSGSVTKALPSVIGVGLTVVIVAGLAYGVYFRNSRGPEEPTPTQQAAPAATPSAKPAAGNRFPDRPRPNPDKPRISIVLFLVDTLRADRLGTYGYTKFRTSPFMDSLAEEGVVFEQAYAPAPWTLPSVVSLMTSMYPCEHGVLSGRQTLRQDVMPLAERLKRIGYTSLGLVGNTFAGEKYGMARGFDGFVISAGNDARRFSQATSRLRLRRPAFIYIHNTEPHNPYFWAPPQTPGFPDIRGKIREQMETAYKEYRGLTRVDFRAQQPLGTTDNTAAQTAALASLTEMRAEWSDLYDAAVREADSRLGSILALLRRSGQWDRTLFILLADHGEELNEHGGWVHDQSVYEELIRVPLIIKFPKSKWAGSRVSNLVSLLDIIPTIADFLDESSLSENASGRSLLPAIRGEAAPGDDEFRITAMRHNLMKYYRPWKETRGDINIAIRLGRWKGIWNMEPDTFELYDLDADPTEQHNLAADHAELVDTMRERASQWHARCSGAAAEPAEFDPDQLSAEELETLRSLGYVD